MVNQDHINIIQSLNIDTCNKIVNKLKSSDYTVCKLMPNEK